MAPSVVSCDDCSVLRSDLQVMKTMMIDWFGVVVNRIDDHDRHMRGMVETIELKLQNIGLTPESQTYANQDYQEHGQAADLSRAEDEANENFDSQMNVSGMSAVSSAESLILNNDPIYTYGVHQASTTAAILEAERSQSAGLDVSENSAQFRLMLAASSSTVKDEQLSAVTPFDVSLTSTNSQDQDQPAMNENFANVNANTEVASGASLFLSADNNNIVPKTAKSLRTAKLSRTPTGAATLQRKLARARALLNNDPSVASPKPHPDGRFPCPYCSKSYLRPVHLQRHVRESHLGFKVTCSRCDRAFTRAESLKHHMSRVHGVDTTVLALMEEQQLRSELNDQLPTATTSAVETPPTATVVDAPMMNSVMKLEPDLLSVYVDSDQTGEREQQPQLAKNIVVVEPEAVVSPLQSPVHSTNGANQHISNGQEYSSVVRKPLFCIAGTKYTAT